MGDEEGKEAIAVVEEDLLDPHPDIHDLFVHYDQLYFQGRLCANAVSVNWSHRMTVCAGLCKSTITSENKSVNFVGDAAIFPHVPSITVSLSVPLLQYRPSGDLKDTLLHEMIHASLMLSKTFAGPDGHGGPFLEVMNTINASKVADWARPKIGYQLSVRHGFVEEVELQRKWKWKCEQCGKCISRCMNRAPSHKDCRQYRIDVRKMKKCIDPHCQWHGHQFVCGGNYQLIRWPPEHNCNLQQSEKRKSTHVHNSMESQTQPQTKRKEKTPRIVAPASASAHQSIASFFVSSEHTPSSYSRLPLQMECPICSLEVPMSRMNSHVDQCLSSSKKETSAVIEVVDLTV